jgi:hypothetical protein
VVEEKRKPDRSVVVLDHRQAVYTGLMIFGHIPGWNSRTVSRLSTTQVNISSETVTSLSRKSGQKSEWNSD